MKRMYAIYLSFFIMVNSVSILAQPKESYKIHDKNRPQPKVVSHSSFSRMATAPSDAIVLFEDSDLSEWVSSSNDKKDKWTVRDNYFEVKKKTGGMGSIYGAVLGTLFIVLMENLF